MLPNSLRRRFTLIVRFVAVTLFVAVAPTASANYDCQFFAGDGWMISSICATRLDANWNYVDSICILNPSGDPWSRYQTMCKVGIDPGTCTGSNCEQDPECTWDGHCTTDFDCCGLNMCDQDLQRCYGPGGGGQW